MFRRWITQLLGSAGYVLFNTRYGYARDSLFTSNNDHFLNDPAFQAAYGRGVKASNGVDPQIEWRVHVALWIAKAALRVPGDFVECGVNAGFISSAIMQYANWRTVDKRFYLIDTFTGPVFSQYSEEEVKRGRRRVAEKAVIGGAYMTDVDRVRANYSEWPGTVLVQGTIPAVLARLNLGAVAFLHIDLNCAYPERAALEFFWDRLSPGAFVLLDDYAYFDNDCLTQAIDDAARKLGIEILSLPTGQGLIIR